LEKQQWHSAFVSELEECILIIAPIYTNLGLKTNYPNIVEALF